MADLNKTIQIIFGATDKTGTVISGVSNRLGSVAAPVADLTKKFLILEGAIAAVGVALAVKAFKESSSFEGALLDLQKVMTDAEGDARQFTGTIDTMSNRYGEASTDILQGAANFKQAGFTVKESFDLQKTALDLVIAGDIEAAQASELLVSTLKGFKAPASEATRLTDILNEVSNNYATNLGQLATGMAELSPIANLMGFSFEETAGVLTPVIEVFRSGSESAVALKTGLLRLVSDQKPVQEALKSIGVSQKTANGELRSGKDILLDVAKAFTTVNDNQKLFVAAELVGIRQAGRMVEVFNGLSKTLEVTKVAYNSAGSIAKEVNIRLEASEKQVDRAKVAFNNMARSIGDQFRPELTGVIGSVTDVEIALQGIATGGGFEPLMKIIRPQLKEWQEVIGKIAKALPDAFEKIDYSPILSALGRIDETFDNMFDGLDLTKPDDLAILFNRIIKVGGSMIDVTAGIVKIFGEVGEVLIKAARWFSDLDPEMQKTIGSIGGISIAMTTLLIPAMGLLGAAIAALSLKFVIMSGARGVGGLVTSLTGASGLTTAIGAASTKATSLGSALGIARFNAVTATSKIGLLTKSLGKAGLVGAVGLASFELSKLGTNFVLDKLFPAKNVFQAAPSDAEQAAFEAKVRAQRKITGAVKDTTVEEEKLFDVISGQVEIKKSLMEGIERTRSLDVVANTSILDITGQQTEAVKQAIKDLGLEGRGISPDLMKDIVASVEAAWDKIDLLNKTGGKNIKESLQNALALPGENTEAEKKALAAIRDKTAETGRLGDAARNADRAFSVLAGTINTGIQSSGDVVVDLANIISKASTPSQRRAAEKALNQVLPSYKKLLNLQPEDAKKAADALGKQSAVVQKTLSVTDLAKQSPEIQKIFRDADELRAAQAKSTRLGRAPASQRRREQEIFAKEAAAKSKISAEEKTLLAKKEKVEDAKLERIQSGEAVINISADGLEPEIEAFMFQILERIQIRANAEGSEYLLGIPA